MLLEKIELFSYRNYHQAAFEFKPGLNVVVGNNASGKSNLLESIYLLDINKSFRVQKNIELIKWGSDSALIKAKLRRFNRLLALEKLIKTTGVKLSKVNGAAKATGYPSGIVCVLFQPEDLKIISDTPDCRRLYLDAVLERIKPGYRYWKREYKLALKQRNRLLKEIADGRIGNDTLGIWDEKLVEAGTLITKARLEFIQWLNTRLEELAAAIISTFKNITIVYESQIVAEGMSTEGDNMLALFKAKLRDRREIDLILKQTTVGPHRDDFRILQGGVDMRRFGSRGEQRALALVLKIAELEAIEREIEEKPILLLDDVMSELDNNNKAALALKIKQYPQSILTCTDLKAVNKEVISEVNIVEIAGAG
jgi:DNA replication and repair protein RecF